MFLSEKNIHISKEAWLQNNDSDFDRLSSDLHHCYLFCSSREEAVQQNCYTDLPSSPTLLVSAQKSSWPHVTTHPIPSLQLWRHTSTHSLHHSFHTDALTPLAHGYAPYKHTPRTHSFTASLQLPPLLFDKGLYGTGGRKGPAVRGRACAVGRQVGTVQQGRAARVPQ